MITAYDVVKQDVQSNVTPWFGKRQYGKCLHNACPVSQYHTKWIIFFSPSHSSFSILINIAMSQECYPVSTTKTDGLRRWSTYINRVIDTPCLAFRGSADNARAEISNLDEPIVIGGRRNAQSQDEPVLDSRWIWGRVDPVPRAGIRPFYNKSDCLLTHL